MLAGYTSHTQRAILFSKAFDIMFLPNGMEVLMDGLTKADIDYVSTVAGYQVTEDEAREFLQDYNDYNDYNDYYEEYLVGPLATSLS